MGIILLSYKKIWLPRIIFLAALCCFFDVF
jgi:hypothetical protein